MYARRYGEQEHIFDFAEGLLHDNLLIVDRETRSIWSQLHNRAVSGALEGTPMQVLPSLQTTWGFWRQRHPETRLLTVPDHAGRPYRYRVLIPGDRPYRRQEGHDTSTLGLGLAFGEEALFLSFDSLAKVPPEQLPWSLEIGGQEVRVHFHPDALTAWAEAPDGSLLPGVLTYRLGWRSFHPESQELKLGARP